MCSHLSESTRCNHKIHPLHSEAPAQLNGLNVTFSCSGEGREEEAHAEGIIDITESIDKGRVPAKQKSTSEATQLDKIWGEKTNKQKKIRLMVFHHPVDDKNMSGIMLTRMPQGKGKTFTVLIAEI